MSCCNPTIIPFYNVSSSSVSYGPGYQAQYGPVPRITVLYWDGTQYVAAGIFTQIALTGYPVTSFTVDHGGPATGILKIG